MAEQDADLTQGDRRRPDLGATPSSRRSSDVDMTGVNPDADAGHSIEKLACDEGDHDWLKTTDTVEGRPPHRRGWPSIRPAPLKCRVCGYRLQTIAFATDQELDP